MESFVETNLERYTFHAITGLTGSGKTKLLRRFAGEQQQQQQIIDFEALANHQGSIFGHNPRNPLQPSQRQFESRLAMELGSMDPARPIWVEAESNRVGNLVIPLPFWRRAVLQPARCLEIRCEALGERVRNICQDENYREWFSRREELKAQLEKLRPILPPSTSARLLEEWKALADAQAFPALVESLLINHYDPRYRKSKVRQALEARGADEVVQCGSVVACKK